MKKNIVLLLLLLILAAIAYYFVNSGQNEKRVYEDRNFAIENIQDIQRIVLADHKANKTTMEKKAGQWIVNDKYGVNERRFETFMNTLRDIEIKYIPSRAESETALKQLMSYTNQIKIYNKSDELMKSYFIGGTNANGNGTYMMMDGADKVFVMHLAHMQGAVDLRYHADSEYWVSKEVFPLIQEKDIKQIAFDFLEQKSESMSIALPEYKMTKVFPGSKPESLPDASKIRAFVTRLLDLKAGRVYDALEGHALDDVKNRNPKLRIKFDLNNGESVEYNMFLRYRRNQLGELIEGQKELYSPRQREANYLIESPDDYYYSVNDTKLTHIFESIQ